MSKAYSTHTLTDEWSRKYFCLVLSNFPSYALCTHYSASSRQVKFPPSAMQMWGISSRAPHPATGGRIWCWWLLSHRFLFVSNINGISWVLKYTYFNSSLVVLIFLSLTDGKQNPCECQISLLSWFHWVETIERDQVVSSQFAYLRILVLNFGKFPSLTENQSNSSWWDQPPRMGTTFRILQIPFILVTWMTKPTLSVS